MPTRQAKKAHTTQTTEVLETVLDLTFLPEELLQRIGDTFDSYFSLGGFRATTQVVAAEQVPSFPNKLSSLESWQIGDLLAQHTAWYSFVNEKLRYVAVAVQVVEAEKERELDEELVRVAGENPGRGGMTENERKSKAKLHPGYLGMVNYANRLQGLRLLLENQGKTFDKNIATLSREVTRRERTEGFT